MNFRDLWYKNAIIYSLDVETFMDGNGDGIGDFPGLLSRLDELAGLGVTCLWLLPFYPSPNRDNGYDITDYYSVDSRLGTLGDFVEFTSQAQEHGIRILIDLVVNHTSSEHPWFQQARQDRHSRYRDYYVWSEEKPEDANTGMVFPGVVDTTWTYDEAAGAYYFHRFYPFQPELNIANPEVQEEIRKIMMFWLQLGVSGFRVDAAPFLIELKGIDGGADDPFEYLRDFRHVLSWRRGDAILLAEANVGMEEAIRYFGSGDKLQMLFHFILNQKIFLALVREDPQPIIEALNASLEIPNTAQWGIFLRNHDELSLDKLTDAERQEVFRVLGPEENMQIYNRGLRRRMAPMFDGDRQRLELAYSLMFSLPGTPILRYGQEIGMGEDLSLEERESVRTPMQWSAERNAGFSDADPDALIRPVIAKGPFSYKKVNFIDQQRDPDSLLNWMQKMIRARKTCPEFGFGTWQLMECSDPGVLLHRCEWDDGIVVAAHNFTDQQVAFKLDLNDLAVDHIVDVLGNERYDSQDHSYEVKLSACGYRWFRIETKKAPARTKSQNRQKAPAAGR